MDTGKAIIAKRQLQVGTQAIVARGNVNIVVYMPEEQEGTWKCEFEIEGLLEDGSEVKGKSSGEDSFEAILNAMQQIALNIYTSELHQRGELWWLEKGQGYGLPLLAQFADMAKPNIKPLQILHVL
jgi:hypothetical protein